MYGDGPLACAAAVLGRTLRQHDSSRARVAVVSRLSSKSRAILEHDGVWQVHEAAPRLPKGSGSPRYRQALARKNELWRLPFDRVVYMDADTFLLADPSNHPGLRSARLHNLWEAVRLDDAHSQLAATPVRPSVYRNLSSLAHTCFNGGFLMLQPSAAAVHRLEGLDPHLARQRPEQRTGRRCPGFDQPLLNSAFPFDLWQRIEPSLWRSITHWMASPEQPATCKQSRREELLRSADAYHFFHKANPWENVYCALCVRSGLRCRPVVPVLQECPVQSLAQQLWWQTFAARPATKRDGYLPGAGRANLPGPPLVGARSRIGRTKLSCALTCARAAPASPTPACTRDVDVAAAPPSFVRPPPPARTHGRQNRRTTHEPRNALHSRTRQRRADLWS